MMHRYKGGPLGLEIAQALAGLLENLDGTDRAFAIVGVNSLSRRGIDAFKPSAKVSEFTLIQLCAKRLTWLGHVCEPKEKRLHIEIGAADDDGPTAAHPDLINLSLTQLEPRADAERVIARVGDVEKMMRRLCLFGRSWLRRADVHAAIHLHGIGADAFAAPRKARGKLD